MKTLIIYSHPYEKSFNNTILKTVEQTLLNQNKEYYIIDLCNDGFNPVYTKEELALYSKGETVDPLVRKYQNLIEESDSLIFISPIWWSNVPAIVKGFFDKVMKVNFAYVSGKMGLKGLLTNIKKAVYISTSSSPTVFYKLSSINAIKKTFLKNLKQVGVKNTKWINCGGSSLQDKQKRDKFLQKIKKLLFNNLRIVFYFINF